jgi:hypothetical protein
MRVKRRAVRLDEAAEGVLIASAGSSNRRSGPSDVVEPSRLVTAEARCRGLRTTLERARAVLPMDLEMRDRLLDQHHVRVPLVVAATRRLAGVLRVGLPPDHGSATRTKRDREYG